MTKQEVQKIFKHYDITLTELKKVYIRVVKEAKTLWREGCIEEDTGYGLGRLFAQVGFNPKYGLLDRADWYYSYMNAEAQEWYYALQVSVLDEGDYTAVDAADWLYENKYYQRTGQIPKSALQETYRAYPLSIKSFEDVAIELAEGLGYRLQNN